MKTQIVITSLINQCNFKIGEHGYVDGYVLGGTGSPLAAVVIGEKVELVPLYAFKITGILH